MYYKGKILGKSPNKVKWDYQMPFKKEIYMNDNKVIIYEPSLEQVSHSTLRTNSDFISIIKSAKKQERINFVDSMGAKSTLKLSNVKLNTIINDKVFDFVTPEGVEVVELKMR